MGTSLYENDNGGIMLNVEAWTFDLCQHGGCESCPQTTDFGPLVTFLYNCAIAVALAAAASRALCTHELVELLSVNGRNLDGAQRRCVWCESVLGVLS